jgi:hypothetical protein
VTYNAAGTRKMIATYTPADTNFTGSTSLPLSQVIKKIPTLLTVTSSLNPSKAGRPVTFTATFNPAMGVPPEGDMVFFYDGTTNFGASAVVSGKAVFTTTGLTAGTHQITAVFTGDQRFAFARSGVLGQVVSAGP